MLVAEPIYRRSLSYSTYSGYSGYSGGLLTYEPANLAEYGFIKINVGKFFKRTVVGGVKKVVRTVKKKPWLAAAAIAGGAGLVYAAKAGYLAPLIAKAKMAKWAVSAKLAPVTARVGAFVKHRIVKPVTSVFASKAIQSKLGKPVKKPAISPVKRTTAMKPLSAGITATAGSVTVKQEPSIIGGIVRTVAKTVTPTLAQAANVLLQVSLAKKGLYYPFLSANMRTNEIPYGSEPSSPVNQQVYSVQPIQPQVPMQMPELQEQQGRTGLASIFGNIPIPLLIIGGIGILAVLLLASSRGGRTAQPAYIPMPYPAVPQYPVLR